jgi:branched-chain amino acid transport system ATP-binding protein
MPSDALLEVSGLCAYYGKLCAVRGISLRLVPGETVCIIGPNGAGKSTLLKSISGVLRDVRGSIRFDGDDFRGVSPQARVEAGLIHVPEGRQIFGAMTVEENVRIGAYARPSRESDKLFEEAMSLFPKLVQRRRQLAGTLSGGEQQMLAMARAVMGRPRLLMLDEPSMGLAPIVVAEIYRQIVELQKRGVTILLVEQNARMALAHSQRALLLAAGEVRHAGSAESIRNDQSLASLVFGH